MAAIDWWSVGLAMLGGLALFLYGVSVLAEGLRAIGEGKFKRLLERSGRSRLRGLTAGTVATIALDSSSVTIILLIATVDAGLIGFANALPMILGANIGTTISSQVFAWNVDEFAPIAIVAGLIGRGLATRDGARAAANAAVGVGLVLFGLHLMGDATAPLADSPDIGALLARLESPLLGVLAGAAATVAIQSSSGMMGIAIVLASGGLISLPAGIAIMLGAEIGTCADTLLATLGRSRAAVRAGLFHLGFNIVSVAIGLALIGPLTAFALASASDTGQQLANAHVLFNVAGALVALPFVGVAAALLARVVPDRDGRAGEPQPQTS